MIKKLFILLALISSHHAYSLPFSEYEKVELYCHFHPENKPRIILGKVIGISNCQEAAHSYAEINNLEDTDWNYIGCTIKKPVVVGGVTIRKGSHCYEKIR